MSVPGRTYVYQDRCPEGTAKLTAALAKAVPNFLPLARNRISHFAKRGPDGRPQPDYADLAQCHRSAAKALAEQGLAVVQTVSLLDADLVLVTQLLHASGEWIQSTLPIRAPAGDPQKLAAAITYARRTAYTAMVGLAADDDDDGEIARVASMETATVPPVSRLEQMALKELDSATTEEQRARVVAKVLGHVEKGRMRAEFYQEIAARSAAARSEVVSGAQ